MGISRRNFLLGSAASSAILAGKPPHRSIEWEIGSQDNEPQKAAPQHTANFQLGLAAYSFRDQFEFMKGKRQQPPENRKLDMFGFLDYCAEHHVAGAELTSYFFPPDADDKYFRSVKRHAFQCGVTISGTAIGNNFATGNAKRQEKEIADAKKWIDVAVVLGAPHIRFFAGTKKDLDRDPQNIEHVLSGLQECVDYAAERGVFIGVENHGQLTSDQMLRIVDGIKSDWFGINLDSGNFQTENPLEDFRLCAPHAVNIQYKVKMRKVDGEKYDADPHKIVGILREAGYRGFFVLEYEEENPFENVPKQIELLKPILRQI